MGREIRRVPPNWKHPTKQRWDKHAGKMVEDYQPMFDESYKDKCRRWMEEYRDFLAANPSGFISEDGLDRPFWDWDEMPPEKDYYRLEWTEADATAYQIYENVTEGTPVSPVFQTVEEMRTWLIEKWELSEKAADWFIKSGYSFSAAITSEGISSPGANTIEVMAQWEDNK